MSSATNSTPQATVHFNASWKSIMECAAVEVFELMAGVRLELNPTPIGEPRGEHTAMVGMAGALCGMTTLRCTQAASAKFASLMLGEEAASSPSSARDALALHALGSHGNHRRRLLHGHG